MYKLNVSWKRMHGALRRSVPNRSPTEEGERVIISVIIVSIKFEICRAINRSSPPPPPRPLPVFLLLKFSSPKRLLRSFPSLIPLNPFSFNCNLQQVIRSKRRQMFFTKMRKQRTGLDVVAREKKGTRSDGYSGQVTFKFMHQNTTMSRLSGIPLLWNNYIFWNMNLLMKIDFINSVVGASYKFSR